MSDELRALDPNVQWIITEAKRPVTIDAAARQRLLDAIAEEALPSRRQPFAWLTEPRSFTLPPLATLAMAAGLVGIGVIAGFAYHRDGRAPAEQPLAVAASSSSQLPDSLAPRVVKFVLIAPDAQRVTLVGDFNGWNRDSTPAVREKDGSWTTFISLSPGRHVYSFVVDGKHFVADPAAPVAPDDGFGQPNSVVIVAGARS